MQAGALAGLLAIAAVAVGCGSEQRPAAPVRLALASPADATVVDTDSVEVRGSVTPRDALVTVEGRDVDVSDGRFSATVDLRPGTNLIDVLAGAERARPAMSALRVTRRVRVTLPDLVGLTPSDATDALAALGLEADVQEVGGFFDFLLPEDARVCETDPPAASELDPGTTVTVYAAKRC